MAQSDCGFCLQLYNCNAAIIEKDFYTFAAKMLCEIADNTGGIGPIDNFNLTQIASETLGPNFYDETLQALQVSVVDNSSIEFNTGVVTALTQRVTLATDVALPAGTNVLGGIFGNVASDAADSGNPVKVGAQARTSDITAVANADRVDLIADKVGKLIVEPYSIPELEVKGTTSADMTTTASTSVIAAVASKKLYITSITISNMSSAVATRVDIQDGSGGTIIWQGPAAAAGGGFTIPFPKPISTTAGNGLFAACATTAAQVRVSAAGYSGD